MRWIGTPGRESCAQSSASCAMVEHRGSGTSHSRAGPNVQQAVVAMAAPRISAPIQGLRAASRSGSALGTGRWVSDPGRRRTARRSAAWPSAASVGCQAASRGRGSAASGSAAGSTRGRRVPGDNDASGSDRGVTSRLTVGPEATERSGPRGGPTRSSMQGRHDAFGVRPASPCSPWAAMLKGPAIIIRRSPRGSLRPGLHRRPRAHHLHRRTVHGRDLLIHR